MLEDSELRAWITRYVQSLELFARNRARDPEDKFNRGVAAGYRTVVADLKRISGTEDD